ncbi:MAG: hypothetical protein Q9186_001979 [Xanthomendoza sp. 1 TL-2023]
MPGETTEEPDLQPQAVSSREPLRAFTNLSATALAIELATQEHPEKHLCPYLHPDKGLQVDRSRRQQRRGSTTAHKIPSTKHTSTNSRVKTVESQETRKSTANSQDLTGESIDLPAKLVKTKDPKSFVQALYDTKALKGFQAATGINAEFYTRESASYQESNTSQPETKSSEGSEQTVENGYDKINTKIEQGKQRASTSYHAVPRHAVGSGQNDFAPQTSHLAPINQQRAQTLSHFSVENVKTLMWWAQRLKERCLKEDRYRDILGWSMGDSTLAKDLPDTRSKYKSVVAFARQSIVYILSSPRTLSSSFRYSVIHGDESENSHNVSIPFGYMVQSFHWLRKLEGCDPIILPSLSSASEALYASLPSRKGSKMGYRTRSATALRALIDHDISESFHHIKNEREAAHLAYIILAALIATIPSCIAQVWWLVYDCHRKGIMAHDQLTDPVTTQSLQIVLDSFEDSTALHLLEKLCKALSTRMSVAGFMNRAKSEDELPPAVVREEKSVLGWILDGLLDTETNPFAYLKMPEDSNVEGVRLIYDHCPPGKQEGSSPSYLLLVVMWLKVLVVKEWDGKPEIDIFSTAGSALEVLRYFRK